MKFFLLVGLLICLAIGIYFWFKLSKKLVLIRSELNRLQSNKQGVKRIENKQVGNEDDTKK